MRIIKKAEIANPETITECYKCQTVFAYESKDIVTDRDGDYVECPNCKQFIGAKVYPPDVQEAINVLQKACKKGIMSDKYKEILEELGSWNSMYVESMVYDLMKQGKISFATIARHHVDVLEEEKNELKRQITPLVMDIGMYILSKGISTDDNIKQMRERVFKSKVLEGSSFHDELKK